MKKLANKMINKGRLISIFFTLSLSISGYAQSISWLAIPQYDKISPFHDGVATVGLNGKWGYINLKGEELVKPEYELVNDFNEGVGVITSLDFQLKAIASATGLTPVPYGFKVNPRFARFSDGLLLVTDGKKWGYLNKPGEIQIKCSFTAAHPFSEGLAAVTRSSLGIGEWAYINPDGKGVILQDNNYNWASSFSNGKAVVISPKQLTFIDARGKKVEGNLPKLTTSMERYDIFKGEFLCKEGTALFDGQGRLSSINVNGTIQSFATLKTKENNELVQVKKVGNKYGFIINGKETPCQFDEVSWFNDDVAIVKKDSRFGIVSMSHENSIAISIKENPLLSVFGKPAQATVIVKNLQSETISNLNISIPDVAQQTIAKLQANESKELVVLLAKKTEFPSEEKELELQLEFDGIQQNPVKCKAIINDKPSLTIEFTKNNFESIVDETIAVPFQVINETDFTVENIAIQVVDETKVISESNVPVLKGRAKMLFQFTVQFPVSATQSQTKEFGIIVKPPLAPSITKAEKLNFKIIIPQPDALTPAGKIRTEVEVSGNK